MRHFALEMYHKPKKTTNVKYWLDRAVARLSIINRVEEIPVIKKKGSRGQGCGVSTCLRCKANLGLRALQLAVDCNGGLKPTMNQLSFPGPARGIKHMKAVRNRALGRRS